MIIFIGNVRVAASANVPISTIVPENTESNEATYTDALLPIEIFLKSDAGTKHCTFTCFISEIAKT